MSLLLLLSAQYSLIVYSYSSGVAFEPTEIVLNFEKVILLIFHILYDIITLGAPNVSLEHVIILLVGSINIYSNLAK